MRSRDELRELRALGKEDLAAKIDALEEELMGIRFKHASGQLEHTAQLSMLRRRIARARTVLAEGSEANG